jgi:hypothetical protein
VTADEPINVDRLSDDQLAVALQAGIVGSDWAEQAAVDLLVQQRSWLRRAELRQAIVAAIIDGELCAWVIWHEVTTDVPASSGELRIRALAASLAGVASERNLGDLLTSLDHTNTARVLRAISIACSGRDTICCGVVDGGEGVS